MGLADCLDEVLSKADRDALKLDLSWIGQENLAPRQRITKPTRVTIKRSSSSYSDVRANISLSIKEDSSRGFESSSAAVFQTR